MSAERATPEQALARTTALIDEQLFDSRAEHDAIAHGLMATTVRLTAEEQNMACRAGQAALATAFQLIARMGIAIELIAPEVALLPGTPALRGESLPAALLDLRRDLIPGAVVREHEIETDLTFAFGDSAAGDPGALAVSVSALGARITPPGRRASRIDGEFPLGGLAAGAAAAAIALQAAMPRIETATGVARTHRSLPSPGPPVDIDLTRLFKALRPASVEIGALDIVSAGAVTNALVNALLWLDARGHASVLDDDTVGWDNLNRCVQFHAGDIDQKKVEVIARASTTTLAIAAHDGRFPEPSEDFTPSLAGRVAVGVDDIRARWWVQRACPAHLYVAATSPYEATVTTHHPGGPCAGCAHPEARPPPHEIPTISFVSYWAGILQACALLDELQGAQPAQRIVVYPFALGENRWWRVSELSPVAGCAVGCPASQRLLAPLRARA